MVSNTKSWKYKLHPLKTSIHTQINLNNVFILRLDRDSIDLVISYVRREVFEWEIAAEGWGHWISTAVKSRDTAAEKGAALLDE